MCNEEKQHGVHQELQEEVKRVPLEKGTMEDRGVRPRASSKVGARNVGNDLRWVC
jgi:hypothetical protein